MKLNRGRKTGRLGKWICGGALGLTCTSGSLLAQDPPASTPPIAPPTIINPGLSTSPPADPVNFDPLAPAWTDPVSRVPNMFGGFFARNLRGSQAGNTTSTTTVTPLQFTGAGAEGGGFNPVFPNGPVAGPQGPYNLTSPIPIVFGSFPNFTIDVENAELTAQVKTKFPGVTFVNGAGEFINLSDATFFYNYLSTSTSTSTTPTIVFYLPNPAGGGLVGRNLYFENGTARPQDRVYFFYNHVGNFQDGRGLDINRYVLGGEKTFLGGMASVELRVPFAGTANRNQNGDQGFAVDHFEFGNVGLALKGVLYRTPNFVASVGLGVSLPIAGDSQVSLAGTPVLEIQNRTYLIQPMLGLAWAPNDRFFAQTGLQFDLDPTGNPVRGLDATGGLSRIGVLHDQGYAYLNTAAGYWVYQGNGGLLNAVALQTELAYYSSFGDTDFVQAGALKVIDAAGSFNVLNLTPSAIFELGQQTRMSIGLSVPVTGERLYDWTLTAQFNYNF